MRRIEIHPSVYLAWNLANIEACLSGSPRIEPIHFLVATLIIIDGIFEEVANTMKLTPETVREIFDIAAECRSVLRMSDDDITSARRKLRTLLHRNDAEGLTMLHRSGESRYIFQRAGRRTIEAGREQLNLRDVFEEILDHMPPDAKQFLNTHAKPLPKGVDEWPDYIVDETRG